MKLTVKASQLRERKSDERDNFTLANMMRTALNQSGDYNPSTTTTDATPLELWRDTVNADSVLNLWVTVTAAAHPDFAVYTRRVVVTRIGVAAAVIQSTDTPVPDFETSAAWDVGFSVSAGAIVMTVTGAAATSISWRADISATWSPFE